ncbi:MAG: radical SAM protein [Euryarchaeota archaeon]|nr:radical SAM protein [Euryarchaeota archaeon]
MRILIIHPKLTHGIVTYEDRGSLRARLFSNPEMTLSAVAAAIPKEHEIRVIHENFEDIDYSNKYDLVGISCFTMFAPQVYEIADKFRNMAVPVVLGGYHPSALPEEAKQHADAVVIGEAEYSLPELLMDLEKGELKPFYKAETMVKGEDIPPLRRDVFSFETFTDGMRITRGCPYTCEFCSITYFFKHSYCKRPIKNVIEELKSLSRKYVYIHDENLTVDIEYSKALFKAMIKEKLNKKWFANGNIYTLGKDEEFLQLARRSGCIGWTVGFESVCQESLNSVKKKDNVVDKYAEWIKNIKKYNMAINGLFMFGFDTDTPDIFDRTLEALDQWEIDAGEFNILTPLPGTPLFDKMEKEGRLLTKDWSKYTQAQVVFQPKNMTPDELYYGTKKVVKEFHTTDKMLKRWIKLTKSSFSFSTITYMIGMDVSRKIWYKREFGI